VLALGLNFFARAGFAAARAAFPRARPTLHRALICGG
jgi:hypothetical protein